MNTLSISLGGARHTVDRRQPADSGRPLQRLVWSPWSSNWRHRSRAFNACSMVVKQQRGDTKRSDSCIQSCASHSLPQEPQPPLPPSVQSRPTGPEVTTRPSRRGVNPRLSRWPARPLSSVAAEKVIFVSGRRSTGFIPTGLAATRASGGTTTSASCPVPKSERLAAGAL